MTVGRLARATAKINKKVLALEWHSKSPRRRRVGKKRYSRPIPIPDNRPNRNTDLRFLGLSKR